MASKEEKLRAQAELVEQARPLFASIGLDANVVECVMPLAGARRPARLNRRNQRANPRRRRRAQHGRL